MFEHHRKSPWFAEKYDPSPDLVQMRARVRKVGWQGRMETAVLDIESGKFDPDLNEPELEPESVSPPTRDNAANGEASITNGTEPAKSPVVTTNAEESKPNGPAEDEMQFNVEAEDEAADQDANRGEMNGKQSIDARRLANRGEEVSIPPEGNQVMIRTIPPDIGRQKLEEVSKRYAFFGLCYLLSSYHRLVRRLMGMSTSLWATLSKRGTTTAQDGFASATMRI